MRQSSSSTSLLLPFGSLMGVIPTDAVSRGRVIGDFSSALDRDQAVTESPATPVVAGFYPACAAWPPSLPSGDGGI